MITFSLSRPAKITIAVPIALFFLFLVLDFVAPVDLNPRQGSTLVLADDQTVLRAFADDEGVWRYPVTLDDVSPLYLEALIGYEDRFFYKHPGVNPFSLGRAFLQALRYGEVVSGGSTLTMQVARLRYPERRNLLGKFKEIVRALQLELHFSKARILTYYLNHAPFGGTVEGVQAAALTYLGYGARDLTHAQAALLAVLPQSPSRLRPDRHPLLAEDARNKVLDRLALYKVWDKTLVEDAKAETVISLTKETPQIAPLFARRLAASSEDSVIKSHIDFHWQRHTEQLLMDYVQSIGDEISAAILIMESKTGKVRVYAGSADFNSTSRAGHVDMVKSIRSPGSTLKPFIYGLAMDEGLVHSESLLMDVPLKFNDYQPNNFNGGFSGPVSMSDSLQRSLNIPAVQVLDRLGPVGFYLSLQAAQAQLELPRGASPNLSVGLGGVGTNLESLVALYSSLDNNGYAQKLVFKETESSNEYVLLSPGSAWVIRSILARDPNAPHGIALKTGTSYGFRDSWALGVADGYTIGVWVGRPDGSPVTGHFGRQTAVPLLVNALFPRLNNNELPKQPESVSVENICWPTGQIEEDKLCDEQRTAWVLDKTIPASWMGLRTDALFLNKLELSLAEDTDLQVPFGCLVPYRVEEVAFWPPALDGWLPQDWRSYARLPENDGRCEAVTIAERAIPLKLNGVEDGDTLQFLNQEAFTVRLRAEGGQQPFHWYVNGEYVSTGQALDLIPETLYRYEIVVMDYHGRLDRKTFFVN